MPLTTPTYDESGQIVHPDIYDAGSGNTWNGHRYWIVLLPFPAGDGTKENPSILVSEDGQTWSVPDGLTNPVVPYIVGSQNADTDLIMVSNVLYIIYIVDHGGFTRVKESHSSDGITWTAPAEIFNVTEEALVSPAVIWDGSQYVMYSINLIPTPNTLERRTCATLTGTWSAAETLTVYLPAGDLWHLDVLYSGGVYYALINVNQASLWIANSANGRTWAVPSPALLADSALEIWDKHIYRSTFLKTVSGFDVWYTGYTTAFGEWHLGFTQATP